MRKGYSSNPARPHVSMPKQRTITKEWLDNLNAQFVKCIILMRGTDGISVEPEQGERDGGNSVTINVSVDSTDIPPCNSDAHDGFSDCRCPDGSVGPPCPPTTPNCPFPPCGGNKPPCKVPPCEPCRPNSTKPCRCPDGTVGPPCPDGECPDGQVYNPETGKCDDIPDDCYRASSCTDDSFAILCGNLIEGKVYESGGKCWLIEANAGEYGQEISGSPKGGCDECEDAPCDCPTEAAEITSVTVRFSMTKYDSQDGENWEEVCSWSGASIVMSKTGDCVWGDSGGKVVDCVGSSLENASVAYVTLETYEFPNCYWSAAVSTAFGFETARKSTGDTPYGQYTWDGSLDPPGSPGAVAYALTSLEVS